MQRIVVLTLWAAALGAGGAARGADWPCIGGDAGLSKYSADNIAADATLQLEYARRFRSKYSSSGNYFYGSSVVVRAGKAIIVADDGDNPATANALSLQVFDWASGANLSSRTLSWPMTQNPREIDSHHYSNPLIWHSDGRVYIRRGGDTGGTLVFLPETNQLLPLYNRDAQGNALSYSIDNTALMQAYKDTLLCRYGHTMLTQEYGAYSISEACFLAPNQPGQVDILGRLKMLLGPTVPSAPGPDGLYGGTCRYGDIPKCANDVCVLAGLIYSSIEPSPANIKVWLQATDLASGQTLWRQTWNSDTGGYQGFSTSVSDYWRFIATDSGHYVFFTRCRTEPVTVRVLDIRTGLTTWSKPMPDSCERPLLAYHEGWLYVIGRSDQYKLDIHTGQEIWHTTHSWPNDLGYALGNHDAASATPQSVVSRDPLYRPVVLTDDTLWFVNGDGIWSSYTPSAATLIGIHADDGQVVRQIDLRSLYGSRPNESLLVVNDLVAADGLLGVLVGVRDAAGPHPYSNGMDYQDLYVFRPIVPGDINSDGHVDAVDLMFLAASWSAIYGDPHYDPTCDLNGDGTTDVVDLMILAKNWGVRPAGSASETDPAPAGQSLLELDWAIGQIEAVREQH